MPPRDEVPRARAEPGPSGLRRNRSPCPRRSAGAEDAKGHLLVPAHLGEPPRQLERPRGEQARGRVLVRHRRAEADGQDGIDGGGDPAERRIVTSERGRRGHRQGVHPPDDHVEPAARKDLQRLSAKPAPRVTRGRRADERVEVEDAHFLPFRGTSRSAAHRSADSRRYTRSTSARASTTSPVTTTPLVRTWSTMSSSDASASAARARERASPPPGGQRRPATKLYGGHGPVRRTRSPRSAAWAACARTACRKRAARAAGTRKAASRSRAGRPSTDTGGRRRAASACRASER